MLGGAQGSANTMKDIVINCYTKAGFQFIQKVCAEFFEIDTASSQAGYILYVKKSHAKYYFQWDYDETANGYKAAVSGHVGYHLIDLSEFEHVLRSMK